MSFQKIVQTRFDWTPEEARDYIRGVISCDNGATVSQGITEFRVEDEQAFYRGYADAQGVTAEDERWFGAIRGWVITYKWWRKDGD